MKISFWGKIREFGGITRILISLDFICAVVLTAIIVALRCKNLFHFDHTILHTLISTFGSLFGLIFTAFSIFISLADTKFVRILKSVNIYDKLIFPFWLVSLLYLLSIIFDYLSILLYGQQALFIAYRGFVVMAIFFTLYSLFATFYRISATVKIGIYRAKFIDYELPESMPNKDENIQSQKPSN